jgi:hypothetical protein
MQPRRRRRPAALLLLALALPPAACGGAPAASVRVPLANNPEGDLAAERCVFDCRASGDPTHYAECLSTCPGAEVRPKARCGADDRTRPAACAESDRAFEAEYGADDGGTSDGAAAAGGGAFLLAILEAIASIPFAFLSGKSNKRVASAQPQAARGPGRTSSAPGHRPASPSSEHRPAAPSGGSSGHRAAKPRKN